MENTELRPGYTMENPGEYIIRHVSGEEPQGLRDSDNLIIPTVTMEGLANFVESRKNYIKHRKAESHLRACAKNSTLTLTIGEHGLRKLTGDPDVIPMTQVQASSSETWDYNMVKIIMAARRSDMKALARELRGMPHLFASMDEMAEVVTILRDTSFKVETVRVSTENEETKKKEESMVAQLIEGTKDFAFKFKVPFYEGQERTEIPVQVMFEISDGDKSKVEAVMYDATPHGIKIMEREQQRSLLDAAIAKIEGSLGVGTIPVVFVN